MQTEDTEADNSGPVVGVTRRKKLARDAHLRGSHDEANTSPHAPVTILYTVRRQMARWGLLSGFV